MRDLVIRSMRVTAICCLLLFVYYLLDYFYSFHIHGYDWDTIFFLMMIIVPPILISIGIFKILTTTTLKEFLIATAINAFSVMVIIIFDYSCWGIKSGNLRTPDFDTLLILKYKIYIGLGIVLTVTFFAFLNLLMNSFRQSNE